MTVPHTPLNKIFSFLDLASESRNQLEARVTAGIDALSPNIAPVSIAHYVRPSVGS